jgi:hypothetical protein
MKRTFLILGVASLIPACSESSESGSGAQQTEPTGDGDGDGDGTGDGDGDGDGDGTGDGDGDGDGNPTIYFDVGSKLDIPPDCACEEVGEFDYLWVAETNVGQLSKLDTNTMQEVARYETREDGLGSPSRTSVSVDGRAVVVANRHGGVTKVWANVEDCEDTNGTPGIQTSQSKDDVLAWGMDECVAWHAEMEDWTTNRPVAWGPGTFNDETCQWENQVVWTAGCGGGNQFPDQSFGSDVHFYVRMLDGDTGEVLEYIVVENLGCSAWGPYGGAIDPDGNFWISKNQYTGPVRIDGETMEITEFSAPPGAPYGITVDADGRPWVNLYGGDIVGVARLDPDTDTWAGTESIASQPQGGLAQGQEGLIWTLGNPSGVIAVDPETLEVVRDFPSDFSGKGISVDGQGRIWRAGSSTAVRFDPETGEFQTYSGYQGAYTYSDMTGFGIANAAGCTPEG